MSVRPQGERLARVEVHLESLLAGQKQMQDEIARLTVELRDDKATLTALTNKGTGLLIGAALAGGAAWQAIATAFRTIFHPGG